MASSRLKRKVEVADQGEYGNLNESFVSIGTALPALSDTKKDKNEFKPVWQQEVYDEQGRRRLHGAFTGGFSAGYFNTVGSKEGWTPSTFKSSRSNRATQGQQSVADAAKQFMDEEDLAEMASSRVLETNSAYSSQTRPSASKPPADYDPLLGVFGDLSSSSSSTKPAASSDDPLASLIQPSLSRIGLEMMRKMGWREGQGVGPRITLAQRKKQARELGIRLDGAEEDEDDGEAARHLYPPLDRPLALVKGTSASTDRGWGLGYQPGMTLNAQLRNEGAATGASSSRAIGVDEDPYGDDRMDLAGLGKSDKRRFRAYAGNDDTGDDDDGYRIASSSKSREVRKPLKKQSTPPEKFLDGTQVLPGFVLQSEGPRRTDGAHLPPNPPPGWKPNPSRLWKENAPEGDSGDVKGKGKQLAAEERGTLLGEARPPPAPKSVFDYLSAKSRDRLASLTGTEPATTSSAGSGANSVPVALRKDAPPPAPPEPDAELYVPSLDRPTALAALKGFQPYSAASTSPDPVKQARYTLYLQYQTSPNPSTSSSPFGPRKLPNGTMQTVNDLNRELSEYAQAARVFKPVSGMLGNRFESSKTGSLDAPKIEPGLYQPPPKPDPSSAGSLSSDYLSSKYGSAPTAVPEPPAPKLTPAQAAAREGNFGPLTRTTTQFRPAKLLCKRFGVRDPYEVGEGGAGDSVAGGAFGEATATGWSTGDASRTAQPVSDGAMEQMMQSAGFKRFQEASKVVDENEPEVAKGMFETPEIGLTAHKKSGNKAKPTLETVGLGDDEAQGEEIVEEQKAPADIFAAIFADSDDEDDEEDEDGSVESRIVEGSNKIGDSAAPSSATTVLSVDPVTATPPNPFPLATPAPPPPEAEPPAEPLSLETIASYKPSFVPVSSRTSRRTETDESSSSKPKKKKAKRKVALSFDVDDGDGDNDDRRDSGSDSTRKRAKKDRDQELPKKRYRPEPVEDEWEEAPAQVHPSILEAQAAQPVPPVAPPMAKGPRARMKAADLY